MARFSWHASEFNGMYRLASGASLAISIYTGGSILTIASCRGFC